MIVRDLLKSLMAFNPDIDLVLEDGSLFVFDVSEKNGQPVIRFVREVA